MFPAAFQLGEVMLTMLVFFFWVIWIYLLFVVLVDIFRSGDLRGGAKALWVVFVIVLPYLGVFVYLISRGHTMQERAVTQAQQQEEAFRSYVQQAAGGGTADELAKLAELRDKGTISDQEFQALKAKALG